MSLKADSNRANINSRTDLIKLDPRGRGQTRNSENICPPGADLPD
jgi:hypothetical protein